jgi:NAD(P)-dependent dehydrogenase (short-subunit alcohol dehydrogenase family)
MNATCKSQPRPASPIPVGCRMAAGLALVAALVAAPLAADSSDPVPEQLPLDGQVILVTGSTGGLGREVALELASMGAHIIVHGRNVERGQEVVAEIESLGTGGAGFYAADFASLAQTRELGEAILRDYDRLDVLVNNAGVWPEGEVRRVTEDGYELGMQVNHLAGFLLTDMLLPLLEASTPSRIINVASTAQTPLDFDDLMIENNYSDGRSYGQSKLAQILFTFELAERLEGTGVTTNTLHPATMMDTNMVLGRGAQARSSVDEGMAAVVHLVTAPDLGSGQFFNGISPSQVNPQANDAEARARLWEMSLDLTGLR